MNRSGETGERKRWLDYPENVRKVYFSVWIACAVLLGLELLIDKHVETEVERWFGFITDQLIRRGSHRSVQALEADIRAWAKAWNEDPKPFIWTKTADEILDSIGRLLTRISGAGH